MSRNEMIGYFNYFACKCPARGADALFSSFWYFSLLFVKKNPSIISLHDRNADQKALEVFGKF